MVHHLIQALSKQVLTSGTDLPGLVDLRVFACMIILLLLFHLQSS